MKNIKRIICFILTWSVLMIIGAEELQKPTLTYIGHVSVKIVAKDGSVLYIDPNYYKGDYSGEADYILVTHGHDDHKPYYKVKLKKDGKQITNFDALHNGLYETFDLCGGFHTPTLGSK